MAALWGFGHGMLTARPEGLSSILLQFFGELRNRLFDLTQYLRGEQLALRAALFETADSVRQRGFLNCRFQH
jgi:hypothetical protein